MLAGATCTLTLEKSGTLNASLVCPRVGVGIAGTWRSVGVHRVDINIAAFGPTIYGWRVAGRRLTLRKIRDRTPIRAAVLWGIWTRK